MPWPPQSVSLCRHGECNTDHPPTPLLFYFGGCNGVDYESWLLNQSSSAADTHSASVERNEGKQQQNQRFKNKERGDVIDPSPRYPMSKVADLFNGRRGRAMPTICRGGSAAGVAPGQVSMQPVLSCGAVGKQASKRRSCAKRSVIILVSAPKSPPEREERRQWRRERRR